MKLENKFFNLIVTDPELNKDILCMIKAASEHHAMNIAYSKGYTSARIATDNDKKEIEKIQREEYYSVLENFGVSQR